MYLCLHGKHLEDVCYPSTYLVCLLEVQEKLLGGSSCVCPYLLLLLSSPQNLQELNLLLRLRIDPDDLISGKKSIS